MELGQKFPNIHKVMMRKALLSDLQVCLRSFHKFYCNNTTSFFQYLGATVACRVCDAGIDLEGKHNQHVVKCSHCQEATPIRPAPPGKKFFFCKQTYEKKNHNY